MLAIATAMSVLFTLIFEIFITESLVHFINKIRIKKTPEFSNTGVFILSVACYMRPCISIKINPLYKDNLFARNCHHTTLMVKVAVNFQQIPLLYLFLHLWL